LLTHPAVVRIETSKILKRRYFIPVTFIAVMIYLSKVVLSTPDLGLIRFPSFPDLDALPTPPLVAFIFAAKC
jgi:hypothetical protein